MYKCKYCLVEYISEPDLINHLYSHSPTDRILNERGSIYGDVRDNMNCAKELMDVLDKYMKINLPKRYDTVGHDGCLSMICHKLARIVTGVKIHPDNYDDICGYAKLARDIAIQGTNKEKEIDTFDEFHSKATQLRDQYTRDNPKHPSSESDR